MEKIKENLYVDKEKDLAVVLPENRDQFVVLNKHGGLVFGPDNRAKCFQFVEEYEI